MSTTTANPIYGKLLAKVLPRVIQSEKENDRYTRQVKSLQAPEPNTIEKEAREQLHYARPGEVVYVSPPPTQPPTRETNAARK